MLLRRYPTCGGLGARPNRGTRLAQEFDRRIRSRVLAPKGGMLDVVARDPDHGLESVLFVECKGSKEKNEEGQEDWVGVAIEEGIPASSFAVAI